MKSENEANRSCFIPTSCEYYILFTQNVPPRTNVYELLIICRLLPTKLQPYSRGDLLLLGNDAWREPIIVISTRRPCQYGRHLRDLPHLLLLLLPFLPVTEWPQVFNDGPGALTKLMFDVVGAEQGSNNDENMERQNRKCDRVRLDQEIGFKQIKLVLASW